jgi:ABC-type uncharacterized transport system substrate-binding protein
MSRKIPYVILLAFLAALFPRFGEAGGNIGKKVLIVHSYDRNFTWTADIHDALERMLSRHQIELRTVFMDTNVDHVKRDETRLTAAGRIAAETMRNFKPDVVIASDDDAQQYFAAQFAGNSSAPAFVFCGVNQDPARYGYPAVNVTGVVEELAWGESLKLLRRLRPNIRKILVLLDSRPSSLAAVRSMRSSTPADIEAEWIIVDTYENWRQILSSSGSTHDALAILNYHNLTDAAGQVVPDHEVMRWTRENMVLPSVGFFDYTVADGALCGVIQTGFEHGTLAGGMALRILNGERVVDIPSVSTTRGLTMLNMKMARKLRIDIPEGLLQEATALVE